jgi:hypothetical protein
MRERFKYGWARNPDSKRPSQADINKARRGSRERTL